MPIVYVGLSVPGGRDWTAFFIALSGDGLQPSSVAIITPSYREEPGIHRGQMTFPRPHDQGGMESVGGSFQNCPTASLSAPSAGPTCPPHKVRPVPPSLRILCAVHISVWWNVGRQRFDLEENKPLD